MLVRLDWIKSISNQYEIWLNTDQKSKKLPALSHSFLTIDNFQIIHKLLNSISNRSEIWVPYREKSKQTVVLICRFLTKDNFQILEQPLKGYWYQTRRYLTYRFNALLPTEFHKLQLIRRIGHLRFSHTHPRKKEPPPASAQFNNWMQFEAFTLEQYTKDKSHLLIPHSRNVSLCVESKVGKSHGSTIYVCAVPGTAFILRYF